MGAQQGAQQGGSSMVARLRGCSDSGSFLVKFRACRVFQHLPEEGAGGRAGPRHQLTLRRTWIGGSRCGRHPGSLAQQGQLCCCRSGRVSATGAAVGAGWHGRAQGRASGDSHSPGACPRDVSQRSCCRGGQGWVGSMVLVLGKLPGTAGHEVVQFGQKRWPRAEEKQAKGQVLSCF